MGRGGRLSRDRRRGGIRWVHRGRRPCRGRHGRGVHGQLRTRQVRGARLHGRHRHGRCRADAARDPAGHPQHRTRPDGRPRPGALRMWHAVACGSLHVRRLGACHHARRHRHRGDHHHHSNASSMSEARRGRGPPPRTQRRRTREQERNQRQRQERLRAVQHLGGRRAPRRRQDPGRDRRCRELRQQPGPGPLLLRERERRRLHPGPDARRPRRLPRPRHRLRRGLRHRQEQGRQGPRRGDLHEAEQHLHLPQGRAHRRHGRARHGPRRPRQVPVPDHREGARRDGRHRRHPQGARSRCHGLLPAGRQRTGDQVVRRAGPSGRRRVRQRDPGLHRARAVLAAPLRARPVCRSSATTSRARSAPRSATAC